MHTNSFAIMALSGLVSLSSTSAFAQGGGDGGRERKEFYEVVRHDYSAEHAQAAPQPVSMQRKAGTSPVKAPVKMKRISQPWDANENNG